MKIAKSFNRNKHKGIAALANESSHKCTAASKEEGAKICEAMKVACHMFFTQAVNLMHEENTAKRASYGSMQTAIDFLAWNGHPGVQPYQITYHHDKKRRNHQIYPYQCNYECHRTQRSAHYHVNNILLLQKGFFSLLQPARHLLTWQEQSQQFDFETWLAKRNH